MLQCVAVLKRNCEMSVRCRVLQCVAMLKGQYKIVVLMYTKGMLVCGGVLQCVAVCCSVLQCVTVCCSVLQCVAVCCSVCAYTKD